jgi:hypothetical protein
VWFGVTDAVSFTVDSDSQVTAVAPPMSSEVAEELSSRLTIWAGSQSGHSVGEYTWAGRTELELFHAQHEARR